MEAPLLFKYIEHVVVVHVWSCMIQVWQQVVFMSLRPWWVLTKNDQSKHAEKVKFSVKNPVATSGTSAEVAGWLRTDSVKELWEINEVIQIISNPNLRTVSCLWVWYFHQFNVGLLYIDFPLHEGHLFHVDLRGKNHLHHAHLRMNPVELSLEVQATTFQGFWVINDCFGPICWKKLSQTTILCIMYVVAQKLALSNSSGG